MKYRDLYILNDGLNACPRDPAYEDPEKEKNKIEFLHLVSRNKIVVREELDAMNAIPKESEEYTKYREENEKICVKFAEKDKEGDPKVVERLDELASKQRGVPIVTRSYTIKGSANPESTFSKESKKLENKFRDVIDKHVKKQREYEEYKLRDVDPGIMKKFIDIDKKLLPDNINQVAMDGLAFIIK